MAKIKKAGKTNNSDVSISPKDLLRAIAKKHLQKKLGEITDCKCGRNKYWNVDGKLLKHYVFTDASSKTFIATPPESIIRSVQSDNATFIGIHCYGGLGKIFTIYFFKPELIIKHYIKAGIEPKNGTDDIWHVTIGNDDENLILTRTGAEPVIVPIDADNYFLHFEMEDEEYEQLLAILPEKKKSIAQIQTTLKVKVKGKKGEEEFSITSAIVIAILSILAKAQKPLTVEEIREDLINYGVLTRAKQEKTSIRHLISKIVDAGGITSIKVKGKPRAYALNKGIKVNVEI